MEKVSVIIPTYNRRATLLRAIKSALDQSYPVHEILVCDDGSTDDSRQLVDSLKENKVRWLDCDRNGLPAVPRNKGVKASTGDWLAFLDSDDEWLPEKIKKQIEKITSSGVKACCSNAYRIYKEKNEGAYLHINKSVLQLKDLLAVNNIICSSALVSKQLLEQTSLFPEEKKFKAVEDYALWLRLSTRTDFAYVNEPLVNYYDNASDSIRSDSLDEWEQKEIIFSDLDEWTKKNNMLTGAQTQELKKQREYIAKKGKLSIADRIKRKFS